MPPFLRRPALIGFLVYTAASLVVGEVFPLSRFAMYANLQDEPRTALLEVRADGVPAEFEDYERFVGTGLAKAASPHRVPFTMGWRLHELRHWARTHPAPDGSGEGPVTVQIGYRILRSTEEGLVVDEDFHVLGEGTAWPRP